jgi:hypothetical protein
MLTNLYESVIPIGPIRKYKYMSYPSVQLTYTYQFLKKSFLLWIFVTNNGARTHNIFRFAFLYNKIIVSTL